MADRVALRGSPPDNGELLEVRELLQAGQRLLLGGRRSADCHGRSGGSSRTVAARDPTRGIAPRPGGGAGDLTEPPGRGGRRHLRARRHLPARRGRRGGRAPGRRHLHGRGGNSTTSGKWGAATAPPCLPGEKEATPTAALPRGGPSARSPSCTVAPHTVDDRALGGRRGAGARR